MSNDRYFDHPEIGRCNVADMHAWCTRYGLEVLTARAVMQALYADGTTLKTNAVVLLGKFYKAFHTRGTLDYLFALTTIDTMHPEEQADLFKIAYRVARVQQIRILHGVYSKSKTQDEANNIIYRTGTLDNVRDLEQLLMWLS